MAQSKSASITIPDDIWDELGKVARHGEYRSAGEVVLEVLRAWMDLRKQVTREIDKGIRDAKRGDVADGPAFMKRVANRLKKGQNGRT